MKDLDDFTAQEQALIERIVCQDLADAAREGTAYDTEIIEEVP